MTKTITIASRGKSMTAELYPPERTTVNGHIVIAYGSDGLTNDLSGPWATMIRGYIKSLAEKGLHGPDSGFLGGHIVWRE